MIYNLQKASLTKRFSAFLFDFMMLIVVFLACALAMSAILGYSNHTQEKDRIQGEIIERHGIDALEEKYIDREDVDFSRYEFMTDEEKAALPEDVQVAFKACTDEINGNEDLARILGTMVILFVTIFSVSLLMSFVILEFIVPLLLKNGQTLGKKIFSLAVCSVDCVKVSPFVLFVRSILGKYTICTMAPLLTLPLLYTPMTLVPIFVVLLVLLLHVVFYFTSGTGALIHDKMAATAVVDMQTQMIFNSAEEKEQYQLRIHREEVEKADY